jgi:hypothetical protein
MYTNDQAKEPREQAMHRIASPPLAAAACPAVALAKVEERVKVPSNFLPLRDSGQQKLTP